MGLKIRNVEFPHHVFMGPGLRGFFGESYWFHFLIKLFFGAIWTGMNFVAKTTTFHKRQGNLELRADGYQMRRLFPRCILAHWLSSHILNAVGLSGPGFRDLLDRGFWQKRTDPWILSFMAVGKTKEERIQEYRDFVDLLKHRFPELCTFGAQIVLQLNLGCPNTENPLETLRNEILECLGIASETGLPLMVNFNALVPPELLLELEQSGLVDCFWIANSIPYHTDHLGEIVFGKDKSPMRQRGFGVDGGVSGPLCLHYTSEVIGAARRLGVKLPIIAGKYYPADLYPHGGVSDLDKIDDVLCEMWRVGIPLSGHFEKSGVHPLDAELAAIPDFLHVADRGDVRAIFEHASTIAALEAIQKYPHAAATITPQHLWMVADDVYDISRGNIRHPHNWCRPVAKTSEDREALRIAAMSGSPKIFFGSDFAPHLAFSKVNVPPPAGCACYPSALPSMVELFAHYGRLDQLSDFTSGHAARFYGIQLDSNVPPLTITEKEWIVPGSIFVGSQGERIVPWLAETVLSWKVS